MPKVTKLPKMPKIKESPRSINVNKIGNPAGIPLKAGPYDINRQNSFLRHSIRRRRTGACSPLASWMFDVH